MKIMVSNNISEHECPEDLPKLLEYLHPNLFETLSQSPSLPSSNRLEELAETLGLGPEDAEDVIGSRQSYQDQKQELAIQLFQYGDDRESIIVAMRKMVLGCPKCRQKYSAFLEGLANENLEIRGLAKSPRQVTEQAKRFDAQYLSLMHL